MFDDHVLKGTDRVPSVPPAPHRKLSLYFENAVPIMNTAESVKVTLTFKAPKRSDHTIDAHATIIVDRSLGSDEHRTTTMTNAMLTYLGGRCTPRSVEILNWNQ